MRILILSVCNFMGKPAAAGDVIEAKGAAEMQAAWYLVSAGKARVENEAVIEVAAEEDTAANRRKPRSLRSSAQEDEA